MDLNAVIIGGGVVGLAIAARLSEQCPDIALLERHDGWGRETSSRNSEVIHGGMYYPAGSLKARLCVAGRRQLYDFCRAHGVPHEKCGKIVISTRPSEDALLENLHAAGVRNGVENLRLLSPAEVRAREPEIRARGALLSSETGILNAHALMDAYARVAVERGAFLVRGADACALERRAGGWGVYYRDADGENAVTARAVINAAGLESQAILRMAGADPVRAGLQRYLCKGEYYSVAARHGHRLRGLVYPVPHANLAGLGVHTVRSLQGGFKLGPNAIYVERIEYDVNPENRGDFYRGVEAYLPFLEEQDLTPDMSGIRPKLSGPGEPARDFHIAHEDGRGLPGFFNLAGIESPGLTASLAIGQYVTSLVVAHLAA